MSNDNYSTPVTRERQDDLRVSTENLHDRMQRFLHRPLDSIEVSGLAEELDGLAEEFRAVRNKSVDDYQDQTVRKYRVLVKSVSQYWTTIECTDAEKWAVARDTDGGIFEEIGEGSWQIESVESHDEF
jgi:hypothetical protein